jgi:hypothetical protein
MEEKIFIAPKLKGSRFEDHSLPVNILEDFTSLEDLLIEVAICYCKCHILVFQCIFGALG